jgi:hypothetical protein
MRRPLAVLALAALPACSVWFFSGETWIDRSRPVALVETTGGIEFGAATEFGVLTLGRSAQQGPCRVHYFLGPAPLVESGELQATSSLFWRADIDLHTQAIRALDRSPVADDELHVMWTPDGTTTRSVAVQLARAPGVSGDVLEAPGEPVPAGAAVLRASEGAWQFVGLVAGTATIEGPQGRSDYVVFAGVDRVRELLAVPREHPVDVEPRFRTDDITVDKPVPKAATAPPTK